jgi:hypothetical protein
VLVLWRPHRCWLHGCVLKPVAYSEAGECGRAIWSRGTGSVARRVGRVLRWWGLLRRSRTLALSAAISATRGHDTPGMAVPTEWDCLPGGGNCYWHGDYVSADGTITYRNIRLHSRGWHEDRPVVALHQGRPLAGPLVFRGGDRIA